MCTEQRKIPKLNTLREDVSQNLQRKWFASLLEPVNLLSVFSGKNRVLLIAMRLVALASSMV